MTSIGLRWVNVQQFSACFTYVIARHCWDLNWLLVPSPLSNISLPGLGSEYCRSSSILASGPFHCDLLGIHVFSLDSVLPSQPGLILERCPSIVMSATALIFYVSSLLFMCLNHSNLLLLVTIADSNLAPRCAWTIPSFSFLSPSPIPILLQDVPEPFQASPSCHHRRFQSCSKMCLNHSKLLLLATINLAPISPFISVVPVGANPLPITPS